MQSTLLFLLPLLFFTVATASDAETNVGFFDDIKLARGAFLPYVPGVLGTITVASLSSLASLITFCHIIFTGPKKEYWGLILPIGLTFSAIGFWLRFLLRLNQTNQLFYNISSLLVVLSPCTYLAFNYILFGRFLAALHGQENTKDVYGQNPYSFISASKVKVFFISSDIITFFIQAGGSSLLLNSDVHLVKAGSHVFLIGTGLQCLSYVVFVGFIIFTHHRIGSQQDETRVSPFNLQNPSIRLIFLLYISSMGILARSVFRIIETTIGYSGYLTRTEIYFLTVDAAPLLLATVIWAVFWPGLLLRQICNQAATFERENPKFEVIQAQELEQVKFHYF